jgi:IPT/TIG domain
MGFAPFVSPLPAHAKVRQKISILGNNLTGSTAVCFNGTPAESFTVNSTGSAITTTVPHGATTGLIQVTLANGTILSSNVTFQVN